MAALGACLCIEIECALPLSGQSVQGPRVLRQSPAWALSGPALPPAKALFGAFPVCRPPLERALTPGRVEFFALAAYPGSLSIAKER